MVLLYQFICHLKNARSIAAWFVVATLASAIWISCNADDQESDPKKASERTSVFRHLTPGESGINFVNALEEGLNTNILMYEYFYNGGGIAAADLNGDTLVDLYFTANMGDNALYLNKGGLQFEDVTDETHTGGRPGPWKTGVAAADVNGDGRMDLYVCYSGSLPPEKRRNELYINMGNDERGIPQFEEKAGEWGLASEAFSTQSYFFDYDKDGDLDMILLNHNPKNLPILNEVKTRELLRIDDPFRGVRLYRQDNGYFNDVTQQAGISSSALTYGLGIGLGDFNVDGWTDIYVSNDYSVPDYLYINLGNGRFQDVSHEALAHISQFSMGNDVGDINHDGLPDIVTLDMLPEDNRRQKLLMSPDEYAKFDLNVRSGFHHQYMRNMLQLNNGNGTFSEIGQLAGISNTDWSWSALLADYDNDGYSDLFVTNGYLRDYTNLDFINYMNSYVQKKGRLQRTDVIEIINQMPSSDLANYMYKGQPDYTFKDVSAQWSLDQPTKSNGAIYADLDNDGDLEIVVNNINQPAFLYANDSSEKGNSNFLQVSLEGEGGNTSGIGARLSLHSRDKVFLYEQYLSRGYQSSVSPVVHFGLGTIQIIDSLVIQWPSGKAETIFDLPVNTRRVLMENNARLLQKKEKALRRTVFTAADSPFEYRQLSYEPRDFDRQSLLISELSETGPCMIKGDINGDGLEDLFVGGAKGQPAALYVQSSSGSFSEKKQPAFLNDADRVDCDAAFFDADNDGDLDLYIVSGGYHDLQPDDNRLQDRLYLNDGNGNFRRDNYALPTFLSSGSCVATADINGDGYTDVFVGGRVVPGRYPESPGSAILLNDGTGKFILATEEWAPGLKSIGMVTDAEWVDMNNDNRIDLVLVGEWMPIRIFINSGNHLNEDSDQYFSQPYSGLWNAIAVEDINEDQKPDFILGNSGTNLQLKASLEEPAELYYGDFDGNGSVDPILCFYLGGESYPFVTRDELRRQLAPIASKYTTHESFADEKITDLLGENQVASAGKLTLTHLETSLFLSQPGGNYVLSPLPKEAQYAPVYVIATMDYDKDGITDLILGGNNRMFKLRLGSADANHGILLKGKGNGSFEYIPQAKSGLILKGDIRSVVQMDNRIYFGVNQGEIMSYTLEDNKTHLLE